MPTITLQNYDVDHLYGIHQTADLFSNIFRYLPEILVCYPGIHDWFDNVVIPDLRTTHRFLSAIYQDSHFAGYMILKHTEQEQKICTLQVHPSYRQQGIGRRLFQHALSMLPHPTITVSDQQLSQYTSLLSEYNFTKIAQVQDAYTPGIAEHIFTYGTM